MLDQLFQEFVGFFAIEVEETDFKVLEVTPTLDVLVVKIVVNAAVSSHRRSFNRCHSLYRFWDINNYIEKMAIHSHKNQSTLGVSEMFLNHWNRTSWQR